MTQEPAAPPQGSPAGAESPGFMRHTLPVGTVIGGFEITGLIGEGGFGIVYLAFDPTLQRQVALKEYMPSSLASRAAVGNDVTVKSARHVDTFNAGLRSFVNEARLLAHFDHPALVKVHQFWQANRTAYMVMPYYQGPTLKAALREMAGQGRTPDEALLRQWLAPLLDALELLHAEMCFHRDVAPDNILLTNHGPLLLDFGAARRVISDMTHALTVMLKPGYAPIEQYGEAASMAQGAWTDLYALGSCVYFAITGRSPITSVERVMGDPLPPLASIAAGRYSARFLRAIDHALAVRPKDRPQNVAEFRALLGAAPASASTAPGASAGAAAGTTARVGDAAAAPRQTSRRALLLGVAALVVVVFVLSFAARRSGEPGLSRPAEAAPEQATAAPAAVKVDPEPAASAPAASPASAALPAPLPVAAQPKAPAALPQVRAPAAAKPAPPASPAPRPTAQPAATAAPPPTPPRPASAPGVAAAPLPEARPAPAPPKPTGKPARCEEILQKGTRQPLSMDDVTFLRQECR
ncbi:MAG: serine/threonine-protein kinase [Burkholderiaceae bacterium]